MCEIPEVKPQKTENIVIHIEDPKGDVDRFLLDLLQEWHNRGGGPDGMGMRV